MRLGTKYTVQTNDDDITKINMIDDHYQIMIVQCQSTFHHNNKIRDSITKNPQWPLLLHTPEFLIYVLYAVTIE